MKIEINDGFNIVYAKSGNSPRNYYCDNRRDVIKFFISELNNIDLLIINDMVIDKNKLIADNLNLSRYLKMKKINNIL